MSVHTEKQRRTILDIQNWKKDGPPLVMLTAYDFGMAQLVDEAGVDLILVGDSGGMVTLGYPSTVPITMEDMIFMTTSVCRAKPNALVFADMPFLSYEISIEEAIRNAGRLVKEAGADGVKLEGGVKRYATIQALVKAGIPVMGHVGLTPQTSQLLGGFKVQGKTLDAARHIIQDAEAVQEAGAFSVVLESIPAALAGLITERLSIPTIGIGAGVHCDGQVLVIHDMLGLYQGFKPKFVRHYAELHSTILQAFQEYSNDVRSKSFPAQEHTFSIDEEVMQKLADEFGAES